MLYDDCCTMRLLELCSYTICLLVCLCSTAYMTYLQFKYYLDNDDLASISYRTFNKEEKDEYPTFSICFQDHEEEGKIFQQSHDAFTSNNITPESYSDYLSGSVKNYADQFNSIKFDDVIKDIYAGYLILSMEDYFQEDHKKEGSVEMLPTYRDHGELCFTKNSFYRKNVQQLVDSVLLNSSMLYASKLVVRIYVHQNGQLLRSFGLNEGYSSEFFPTKNLENGIVRKIYVGQVDVLRKRAKGKIPCDQYMQHEDQYRMDQVIKITGCIPTFWKPFSERTGLNQTTPMCRNVSKYNKVAKQIHNILTNFDTTYGIYKSPCSMMMISITTSDESDWITPGVLAIELVYKQNLYREILNTEAYTSETLLGQFGGFVGMQYQIGFFDILNLKLILAYKIFFIHF